jgi:hypothetical protein
VGVVVIAQAQWWLVIGGTLQLATTYLRAQRSIATEEGALQEDMELALVMARRHMAILARWVRATCRRAASADGARHCACAHGAQREHPAVAAMVSDVGPDCTVSPLAAARADAWLNFVLWTAEVRHDLAAESAVDNCGGGQLYHRCSTPRG